MRNLRALSLAAAILFPAATAAAGAANLTRVCHGEFESTCKLHPYDTYELCSIDTASNATCQRYCGKDQGPGKCSITKAAEQDGNRCGYVWISVRCF
jgi:hypothetical protein